MAIINTFGEDISLAVERPTEQAVFVSYVGGVLNLTRGNGQALVIFLSRKPINLVPRDLETFREGQLYKQGEVLYKGTETEIDINLQAGIWYLKGFEFNGEGSTEKYLINSTASAVIDVGSDKIFGIEFDDSFE